ncbi:MAG TPA: response regulator [bacterium]|nr:response regulator [bacterium]HPR87218.1 response regulator [bacterium]
MNCLIVANPQKSVTQEVTQFLSAHSVATLLLDDPFQALELAQGQHFDLILLDARTHGLKIDQAIRLLKGCDPSARIIVRTDENTRALEGKVRKEQIFYYHVDSLGIQDLQLAMSAALGIHVPRQ